MEGGRELGMEGGRELYLIMTDSEFQYCLYRIRDPQVVLAGDESSVINLGEPLVRMDKSTFPDLMSFSSVGSCIYMVGVSTAENGSNKVFIYDTASAESKCVLGPTMNSGKCHPLLFPLGSKLFALSYFLYPADRDDHYLDHLPRFEMLDTDDIESPWSPLPVPIYPKEKKSYAVVAYAAVYINGSSRSGGVVFVTVGKEGTYAFDVDKRVWNHASADVLPFYGHAVSIPHEPYLCCAHSSKSKNFSAFRFWYGDDDSNPGFRVDEFVIEAYRLSPMWPQLVCNRPLKTAFGPDGRGYFIMTGVDQPRSYASTGGNRYVKVYALQFSMPKLNQAESTEGQWLKMCSSKKRQIEHDETPEVKWSLRRCGKAKKKSRKGNKVEEETSRMGKGVEEETEELKLTNLWEICICGGPICDELIHVAGAFAM